MTSQVEQSLWRNVLRLAAALREATRDTSLAEQELLVALAASGLTLAPDRGRLTARRVLAVRFDV